MFALKRKLVYLAIFLMGCFLFFGFIQPKILSENIDSAKNNLIKQSQSVKVSSALETWVGEYSFSEYAPPNINMFYSISIYSQNNKYFAKISNDGFQTLERVLANVDGDKNSIKLVFLKYLPDNMFESYKKGDVLISFEKRDSKLITNWGKIKPILLKNNKAGECFQLNSSSKNSK